jgi:hypothetical protein
MLGKKVKDNVTGFTGIATARVQYLNGCVQFKIQGASNKSGEAKDMWIDEGQISVLGKGISVNQKRNGGPAVNTPKGLTHP